MPKKPNQNFPNHLTLNAKKQNKKKTKTKTKKKKQQKTKKMFLAKNVLANWVYKLYISYIYVRRGFGIKLPTMVDMS